MDRWQQIEDVYHAALERERQDRASFLDEACGRDEALRKEIESLLLEEPEAVDFLEASPQWQPPSPAIRQRAFRIMTSKRALQLAMVPPIIIIAWAIVKNRNRTIADVVGTNTAYFYWIATLALLLQFRDKIRMWLGRNFFPEEYESEQVLPGKEAAAIRETLRRQRMQRGLKECPECGKCFDNTSELCDRDGQPLTTSVHVERTIHDKYRLDMLIGRGGMGAVYEAQDLRLERKVAVKIMAGGVFGEQTDLRRFHREARSAARLNHPNIVSVFDFGSLEDEAAYLVMERIHGTTLRSRLQQERVLSPPVAADWFDGILQGLAAAHDAGIVHRDLKPENVIAEESAAHAFNVKILDFGLAKFRSSETTSTTRLTAGGFVIGTPGYMSPEYLLGRDVDHRSDLFSVGVMLVEVLTGSRPFDEFGQPVNYILPSSLKEIVQKCLAQDPDGRPSSARELRHDLITACRLS